MEQTERITQMEAILDRGEAVLSALNGALEQYRALAPELDRLAEYYSSAAWREDFEADEAGLLPADLRRGVLSEDGIWNLLADRDGVLCRMRALCRDLPEDAQE